MQSPRAARGVVSALVSVLPGIALWLLTRPFVYRDVTGEPDVIRMINGVLYDHMNGAGRALSMSYGYSFSFGYYWLLGLLPHEILHDAARLVASVNLVGHAGAALAIGSLGLLAWRLYGLRSAVAIGLLVGFSPMVLELSTYGHPQLVSAAALFLGAVALVEADARTMGAALVLGLVGGLLLFSALAIRSDCLLAFPWVAILIPHAAAGPTHRTRLGLRVGVMLTALASFLWVQRAVVHSGVHGAAALEFFFRSFYRPEAILRDLGRGFGSFALGAGVATCVVAFVLFVRFVRRQGLHGLLEPSILLLAAALAFGLPDPIPSRHFFYGLVAMACLFAVTTSHMKSAVPVLGLAASAVVINQVAGEWLYRPVVALYPGPYPMTSPRRATGSVPYGASLPNHQELQRFFGELRREGRDIAGATDRDVVVFADYDPYIVLGLLEHGGVRAWKDTVEAGLRATRIERGVQTFHLVSKVQYWPRDVAADYMRADPFPRAAVYVQPSTRSRYDREPMPSPDRALRMPSAAPP